MMDFFFELKLSKISHRLSPRANNVEVFGGQGGRMAICYEVCAQNSPTILKRIFEATHNYQELCQLFGSFGKLFQKYINPTR